MSSGYTYEVFYSKLTEVKPNPEWAEWVKCSFRTTNCAIIGHLKKLQMQEDRGMICNIEVKTLGQ